MKKIECKFCQNSFLFSARLNRKFCNRKCYSEWRRRNWKRISCLQCGKSIVIKKHRNRKFCSRKCFFEFKTKKVKINCHFCNKIIYKKLFQTKLRQHFFCSIKCYSNFRFLQSTKKISCDFCDKSVLKSVYRLKKNKHNFCSYDCFVKFKKRNQDQFTHRTYEVDWNYIAELYLGNSLSIPDLAKEFKLPSAITFYHLKKLGITRNQKETVSLLDVRLKFSRSAKIRAKKYPSPLIGCLGFFKDKKRPEHSKFMSGIDRGGKESKRCPICGKTFTAFKSLNRRTCGIECKKIRQSFLMTGKKHIKNGNILDVGYPNEFYRIKDFIRERDGSKCQNESCGISQKECVRKLSVHHIDYNKKNTDSINLISLCRKCHQKTNYNRKYWQNFYENIQIKRRVHLLENIQIKINPEIGII